MSLSTDKEPPISNVKSTSFIKEPQNCIIRTYSCGSCDWSLYSKTELNDVQRSYQDCNIVDISLYPPDVKTYGNKQNIQNEYKKLEITGQKTIKNWSNVCKSQSEKEIKCKYKIVSQINDVVDLRKPKAYADVDGDVTKVHSVTVNYSCKENSNPTAKLTAQVMNVPLQELKSSSLYKAQEKLSSQISVIKQDKIDLFSKLKEIYNACSCKVCECLAGTASMSHNDKCMCEKCNYKKYTSLRKSLKEYSRQIPLTANVSSTCDCMPCDCVKCIESFTKQCDCEPCNCVECSNSVSKRITRQTIVVAPVAERIQSNICQCEPCECLNCTHNYGAMSTRATHDTPTGEISHSNCYCESCLNDTCELDGDNCKCESRRGMKKPIEKNNQEYDIHNAFMIDKYPFQISKFKTLKSKNNNSMSEEFAPVSNTYLGTVLLANKCKCVQCQCLICKDKEKMQTKLKSMQNQYLFDDDPRKASQNQYFFNDDTRKACQCLPCECSICDDMDYYDQVKGKFCRCDTCLCIDCHEVNNYIDRNIKNQVTLKHIPPYFKNQTGSFYKMPKFPFREDRNDKTILYQHDTNFPFKKGKLLTPSMFEANINNLLNSNEKECDITETKEMSKEITNELMFSPRHLITQRKISKAGLKKSVLFKNIDEGPHLCYTTTEDGQPKLNRKSYSSGILHTEIDYAKSNIFVTKMEAGTHTENIKILQINSYYKQGYQKTADDDNKLLSGSKSLFSNFKNDNKKEPILLSKLSKSKLLTKTNTESLISFTEDESRLNKTVKRVRKILDEAEAYTNNLRKVLENAERANREFVSISQKIEYDKNIICNAFNCDTTPNGLLKGRKPKDVNFPINIPLETKPSNSVLINGKSCVYHDRLNSRCIYTSNPGNSNSTVRKNKHKYKEIKVDHTDITNKNKLYKKNLTYKEETKNYPNYYKTIPKEVAVKNNTNFHDNNKRPTGTSESQISSKLSGFNVLNKRDLELKVNDTTPTTKRDTSSLNGKSKYNRIELKKDRMSVQDSKLLPAEKKKIYLSSHSKTPKEFTLHDLERELKETIKPISDQADICGSFSRYSEHIALKLLKQNILDLLNSLLIRSTKQLHQNNNILTLRRSAKTKLDLELKTAKSNCDNDIQLQIHCDKVETIEKGVSCDRKHSMALLKHDIRNQLKTIISRAVYKSELLCPSRKLIGGGTKKENANIIKYPNDRLKARFKVAEKVSDHTVLVRWETPLSLEEVEGYELQVDGRAVQKIFNPTNSMAVISCLPDTKKVLIAIRTITSNQLSQEHYPISTITYSLSK